MPSAPHLPAMVALALLAEIAAAPSPAAARPTLVGTWAIAGQCERPLSTIVIGSMSLGGEDFGCVFSSVRRVGDTVSWAGRCNFSEGGYEPTQVVAQLVGPRLRYRFVGQGWNGPFLRCAGR